MPRERSEALQRVAARLPGMLASLMPSAGQSDDERRRWWRDVRYVLRQARHVADAIEASELGG